MEKRKLILSIIKDKHLLLFLIFNFFVFNHYITLLMDSAINSNQSFVLNSLFEASSSIFILDPPLIHGLKLINVDTGIRASTMENFQNFNKRRRRLFRTLE